MKKSLCTLLCLGFLQAAQAGVMERYWTIADKDATFRMIQGRKRGVSLNIHAYASKNLADLVEDGKDAADTQGGTANKQTAVEAFLNKYDGDEFTANGSIDVGVSLPVAIPLAGRKLKTDFRAHYDLGALLGLTLPNSSTVNVAGVGAVNVPLNVPFIQAYAAQTVKTGVNFGLQPSDEKKLFGGLHLYHMSRWDRAEVIDRDTVISQGKVIELDKPKNTTTSLSADISLGYKLTEKLRIMAVAEEVRLAKLSDKEDSAGKLLVNTRALYRLHGSYELDLARFKLTPFAGVHQRSGYDLEDGLYAGARAAFQLAGLGASATAMVDNNFFTVSPHLKLWLFNLSYTLRLPVTSQQDGFNLKPIHAATLGFTLPYGNS